MSKFDLQACDDRRYIQKLVAYIIEKSVTFKDSACKESSRRISEFLPGDQDINICNIVTPTVLTHIADGNQTLAIEELLNKLGYPRATYRLVVSGYKNINEADKREIVGYLVQQGREYTDEQIIPAIQKAIAEIVVCPTKERTNQIINSTNRLKENLVKIQTTVEYLRETLTIAYSVVVALKQLNKAIKLTLTLIPTPPIGVPGLAGVTQILSEKIQDNKQSLKDTDKDICDAINVLTYISTQLNLILAFLSIVDMLLQQCLQEELDNYDIEQVQALNLNNFNSIGSRLRETYKEYTLEIRVDENSPAIAQRRFAVALDPSNVVILQGPSSFSSSTQILLDELKFRIDNQLG